MTAAGADRAVEPGDVELSVVVPLEDPRGDIADHLGTWTRDQGLPRERYQLVVAGNGEDQDFERDVARILAPHDAFVPVPGGELMELYAGAARVARAPLLLLTEAHCRAEPGCLGAVAEAFAADPRLAAATLDIRQHASNATAELIERWIARAFEGWDRAGWPRFHVTGVAIRAEAYDRAGGIDPPLELYATSCLSARLHHQGAKVAPLEGAVIHHTLEEAVGSSLADSRSFARGERLLRARDPEFCERYFGPPGLWGRRLAYRPEIARSMLAALTSAVLRSPRDAGWLARELVARLPAGVAGSRPRRTWERATASLHRAVAGSSLVPLETRWRSLVAAQTRTVAAAQLPHSVKENGLPPSASGGTIGAEGLDGVLVGAHGLEQDRGRRFRWTEPVALLRLAAPADGAVLRMETGGLRGRPLDYLHGIYAGGSPLRPEMISGDDEMLEARLPPDFARAAAGSGIVLMCRPLIPSRKGSSDRRRLGMPVVEFELGPS